MPLPPRPMPLILSMSAPLPEAPVPVLPLVIVASLVPEPPLPKREAEKVPPPGPEPPVPVLLPTRVLPPWPEPPVPVLREVPVWPPAPEVLLVCLFHSFNEACQPESAEISHSPFYMVFGSRRPYTWQLYLDPRTKHQRSTSYAKPKDFVYCLDEILRYYWPQGAPPFPTPLPPMPVPVVLV